MGLQQDVLQRHPPWRMSTLLTFSWPDDLEAIATSSEEISLWVDGNSPWDLVASGFPLSRPYPPIVCATKDYTIATGLLPEHMILTPARVACWHSHLAVIQKLANGFQTGMVLGQR